MRHIIFLFFFIASYIGKAQVCHFPHIEDFDSVIVPDLPFGWEASTYRSITGDFVTVQSSAFSGSNAVMSTNAKIEQHLYSPFLDFSDKHTDSLTYYERRSGSHDSDILIEASIDDFSEYSIRISDTLRHPGTSSYILRSLKLPDTLSGSDSVKIRWRVTGNGTGSTGTVRFDNIAISAIYNADCAVVDLKTDPLIPKVGDDAKIGGIIKNVGFLPLTDIRIDIYTDVNKDGYADPSELFGTDMTSQTLLPGETVLHWFLLRQIPAGEQNIIFACFHPDDTNPQNDYRKFTIVGGYPHMAVVVNEIMYAPFSGNAEYVELFNSFDDSIDIKGWTLTDKGERDSWSTSDVICNTPMRLGAKEIMITANDSSVFYQFPYLKDSIFTVIVRKGSLTLNNSGDNIILADINGRCIDSVYYSPDWHNPYVEYRTGRSLERINPKLGSNDPFNWGTCPDPQGGTPGLANLLFTEASPINGIISASPNPFSPDGDGHEDITILRYSFTEKTSIIRLRIFDVRGRLVRTLAHCDPSGPTGERIWDGYNEHRERVRIGIYIVLLEGLDENGNALRSIKSAVVVAAKM